MKHTIFSLTIVFLFTFFNSYAQDAPTEEKALVTFKVTDYSGIPEEGAEINITGVDTNITAKGVADIDGKYKILLPEGKQYKLMVFKFGEEFEFDRPLDIPATVGAIKFEKNLKIKLITEYVKIYKLDHIYFDFNKADIKKESEPALTDLLKKLNANPNLKIEIAGHTDDKGSDDYNLRLSQKRADAIVAWLFNRKVDASRLLAKGYGETVPIVPNDSDENCAKNRRTEVRVIQE
jgi:outer membrane protein OmpA-like peptidoglycan-associated protein